MRAVAISTARKVAVMTENSKPVRKVVFNQPIVELIALANLFTVASPATIDVINSKELNIGLATTGASQCAVTVMRENGESKSLPPFFRRRFFAWLIFLCPRYRLSAATFLAVIMQAVHRTTITVKELWRSRKNPTAHHTEVGWLHNNVPMRIKGLADKDGES